MTSRFTRDATIFVNRTVLTEDYQPDEIHEREDIIKDYELYLQPIIEGATPLNIFIYGKTGVGKTAMTKTLLADLENDAEAYDDLDVSTIYLNCENFNSSYRVASELVNELRQGTDREQIPTTGHSARTVYSWLWDELEQRGGTIVLVFDEVDNLGDDDSLLYQIPRAKANDNLEEARVGIIGISNDLTFRENLDPRVKDTLCEREIQFPPYNASSLRSILKARADRAFRDGVISQPVIQLSAALAARDKGSARQALNFLREAGFQAMRDDESEVRVEHVRQAEERLEHKQIEESLTSLTTQAHFTLSSVIQLMINDPDSFPAHRDELHEQYRTLSKNASIEPVKVRRFHDHLSELVMLGVLKRIRKNEGPHSGRFYVYDLNVPLDIVLNTLIASDHPHLDHKERWQAAISNGLIDADAAEEFEKLDGGEDIDVKDVADFERDGGEDGLGSEDGDTEDSSEADAEG